MLRACIGIAVSAVLTVCAATAAPIPKGAGEPKFDLPKELGDAAEAMEKSQAGGEDGSKARATFNAILQKIAPALPEVTPVKGEAKKYTKVTLNKEGKKLGAFRFKTPDSKMNWNISWEFVMPPDALHSWYILPREGKMSGFRTFTPGTDYQEEGAGLPEKNYRIVQPLDGGNLKPGTDYVIWFTFKTKDPVDLHIRIGLTEGEAVKVKD